MASTRVLRDCHGPCPARQRRTPSAATTQPQNGKQRHLEGGSILVDPQRARQSDHSEHARPVVPPERRQHGGHDDAMVTAMLRRAFDGPEEPHRARDRAIRTPVTTTACRFAHTTHSTGSQRSRLDVARWSARTNSGRLTICGRSPTPKWCPSAIARGRRTAPPASPRPSASADHGGDGEQCAD